MAVRYIFPCPQCGHANSVSSTTAGQEANCSSCGSKFEVPQLKILKGFELAVPMAKTKPKRSTIRPQILFVFGMLLCLLGTISGFLLLQYSKSLRADFSNSISDIEKMAEGLGSNEVLQEWYYVEKSPDLPEWQEHPLIRNDIQGKILAKIAYGLLGLGGVGFLLICFGLLDRLRSS